MARLLKILAKLTLNLLEGDLLSISFARGL